MHVYSLCVVFKLGRLLPNLPLRLEVFSKPAVSQALLDGHLARIPLIKCCLGLERQIVTGDVPAKGSRVSPGPQTKTFKSSGARREMLREPAGRRPKIATWWLMFLNKFIGVPLSLWR